MLFERHPSGTKSSYGKVIREGIRTVTCGAHASLAAQKKSHMFVTHVTTGEMCEIALKLCRKPATLMPQFAPYLAITVVYLTTGEDFAPHHDIQNH